MTEFLKHIDRGLIGHEYEKNFVGRNKIHFGDIYASRVIPMISGCGNTLLPKKKQRILKILL